MAGEIDAAQPLRVGVVGAGPWARTVHAPLFADHPGTALAAVWARRPEAAAELAAAHGALACATFDELLDHCEAVVFAVPPDVQAELAVRAARAGKALLLEKPLALDLAAAERLADAVGDAGVGSQVVLTWRYADAVRAFLASLATCAPIGGRAHFVSGGLLGGPFATPWRLDHGILLDLGPHVLDLLDASFGTVVGVRAHGDVHGWVGLLLEHEGGAVSEASMCATSGVEPMVAGVEAYTRSGAMSVDTASAVGPATMTTIADELVRTAAGTPHLLDVHRGLHLQRLVARAHADLAAHH